MPESSEEALLLAIETRDVLFSSLKEMLSSENYLTVLMYWEEGLTQQEIGERADVGQTTVSRGVRELKELDLIEETENRERKALPVLDHPIIQHFFEEEVRNND